jgi:uncharacterized protein
VNVTLVLTHDCNLACDYCYAGEKRRRPMGDDVLARAIELAFCDGPRGDSERVELALFGGEPLLEWEQLTRAVALARKQAALTNRELAISVTTNGALVDAERARFFVENELFVALSIDGVRAAHEATRPTRGGKSSFDAVVRGLDRLVDAGARLMTISVVDPRNVHLLGESARFIASRGVRRLVFNPNYAADWSDAALATWRRGFADVTALWLERHLQAQPIYVNVIDDKLVVAVKGGYEARDQCAVGHGRVAVAPSGNLYPCERLVGDDDDPALRIGDVFGGVDAGRLLCIDAQRGPVNHECNSCSVRESCASFCACANRAETGELGVAGGVQCWHEQTAIEFADVAAEALVRAQQPRFVARLRGEAAR